VSLAWRGGWPRLAELAPAGGRSLRAVCVQLTRVRACRGQSPCVCKKVVLDIWPDVAAVLLDSRWRHERECPRILSVCRRLRLLLLLLLPSLDGWGLATYDVHRLRVCEVPPQAPPVASRIHPRLHDCVEHTVAACTLSCMLARGAGGAACPSTCAIARGCAWRQCVHGRAVGAGRWLTVPTLT
jgi:hypothetical protein